MDLALALAVAAVVAAWVVFFLAVRRWGPGRARRWVRCPTHKLSAKLLVEQREADFGRLRVTDVVACSLLPHRPLDCGKECLDRF